MNTSMKTQLLELVEGMTEDGYSFSETPAVFKWKYKETPSLQYSLIIEEVPSVTN